MPFEIRDNASALTKFLIDNGYEKAKRWEGEYPTYHIDVFTTEAKEVDDPVLLHPSKFGKVSSPHSLRLLIMPSTSHIHQIRNELVCSRVAGANPSRCHRFGCIAFQLISMNQSKM